MIVTIAIICLLDAIALVYAWRYNRRRIAVFPDRIEIWEWDGRVWDIRNDEFERLVIPNTRSFGGRWLYSVSGRRVYLHQNLSNFAELMAVVRERLGDPRKEGRF